jgi:hypothetical protein
MVPAERRELLGQPLRSGHVAHRAGEGAEQAVPLGVHRGREERPQLGGLDEHRGVEVADHPVGPVAEQPETLVDQPDLVGVEDLRHGVPILVVLPHDP